EHISAQGLKTTLLEINQRPLKILDWQTPYQVMLTNFTIYLNVKSFLKFMSNMSKNITWIATHDKQWYNMRSFNCKLIFF
ncbi:MAG: hypothetical protein LIR10_10955, partial [Bacillota bacterium]|nr:hypothetical protein [Bacillota bacterium]